MLHIFIIRHHFGQYLLLNSEIDKRIINRAHHSKTTISEISHASDWYQSISTYTIRITFSTMQIFSHFDLTGIIFHDSGSILVKKCHFVNILRVKIMVL